MATSLAPGLYVTATPIGNASDITLRALNVLALRSYRMAETQVTSRLPPISRHQPPLLVYNDHNGPAMRPKLLENSPGARFALVSDAGTPLVSDPGHKLVKAALAAGIASILYVASAVLTAPRLGIAEDGFFGGFLPAIGRTPDVR